MPINPAILDELAAAGANLSIDAATPPPLKPEGVCRLWLHQSGNLTIRNATAVPPPLLVQIARGLGSRVTLVE